MPSRSPVLVAVLAAGALLTSSASSPAAAKVTCDIPSKYVNLKSVKASKLSCSKALKVATRYSGANPDGYLCSEKALNSADTRVTCRVEGDGESRVIFVRHYESCTSECRVAPLPARSI